MNLFCKIALGLVGLILVLVFLAVLAVAVGIVKAPKLVSVKSNWAEVTHDSTQVVTAVAMDNPNSFDINTGRLSFQADISMNDVQMGRGALDTVHLPRGASTTKVTTHIDNNRLPAWWVSHITNHEFTTVHIAARVILHLLGRSITFSGPDLSRTVQTDLLGKATSTDPQVLSSGQVSVLIKSRELHWGQVTTSTTEVLGSMVVRNTSPYILTVTRAGTLVRMNELLMAQGDSVEPVTLPPNKDVTVPFRAVMDNKRLLDWWPTHVNAGERTTFYLQLDATVLVSDPAGGGSFSASLPLLVYQDQFVTHLLGE